MEEWRDVPGYEGLYKVSSMGRVMRCDEYKKKTYKTGSKNRILKANKDGRGYYIVGLCKNGKRKMTGVHKIVLNTFLEKPKNKKVCIDHINRDKSDNSLQNLRWVSWSENCRNNEKVLTSSCKYNGVNLEDRYKVKKYRAAIGYCGKDYHLGRYENAEDAARAFDRFVIERGLDRVLNFPENALTNSISGIL